MHFGSTVAGAITDVTWQSESQIDCLFWLAQLLFFVLNLLSCPQVFTMRQTAVVRTWTMEFLWLAMAMRVKMWMGRSTGLSRTGMSQLVCRATIMGGAKYLTEAVRYTSVRTLQ